jgi:hypothetical protein
VTSRRSIAGWLIVISAAVLSVAVLAKAVVVVVGGGSQQASAALPSRPARVGVTAPRHHAHKRHRQPAHAHKRHRQPAPAAATDARIVGVYEVVGDIISTYGFSGERPGDALLRGWLIQRSCAASDCRLVLSRTVAAVSGVPPLSAVLHPTRGGWTAHFTETQGCPSPSSPTQTTEFSTWKLWAVANGLQATELAHQPASGECAAAANTIHWYAKLTDRRGQHAAQPNPSG